MTGIERLRKLSEDLLPHRLWNILVAGTEEDWDCHEGDFRTVSDELLDIANQIEREHADDCFRMGERAADVFTSAYDLLPADEREAIAWVREHGGLNHVKAEWRSRVPYNKHERARQRLLDHIAECETALGRRNVRIEELGHRVGELTAENAALRKRAMPEGYEWPHYEDESPVPFGDTLEQWPDYDGQFVFDHLEIYQSGELALSKTDGLRSMYSPGERVRRPQVLAADGEPLEAGQTVYGIGRSQHEFEVLAPNYVNPEVGDRFSVKCLDKDENEECWCDPNMLTHKRPVLDADGVTICEGDTVYDISDGTEFVITSTELDELDHVKAHLEKPIKAIVSIHPLLLTHTKPEPSDSWERVEEDAKKDVCVYFNNRRDVECTDCPANCQAGCETKKSRDLVRRCRALAERERR